MLLPIVIREDAPFLKSELVEYLEQWNIETRDMMPLINQSVYRELSIRQEQYPIADWVNRCGFCIGCHQGLTERELWYVGDVFSQFFAEHSLLVGTEGREKRNLLRA